MQYKKTAARGIIDENECVVSDRYYSINGTNLGKQKLLACAVFQ